MLKIKPKKLFLPLIIFCALIFKYWSIWGLFNDNIKYVFFVISILLSIFNIVLHTYNKKELRNIFLFFLLSVIICYSTNEIDFIYSFILAIVFMKEDKGDYLFIKYFVISAVVLFSITIILGKLGIISTFTGLRRVNGVVIERNSLGFEHVNAVFKNFFPICLGGYILCYSKSDRKKAILYLLMSIIGFILYKATNCRTGYYVILLIIPLDILMNRVLKKFDFKISIYYFIIFTIISIIVSFVYGKSNNAINVLLSDRPIFNYRLLTESQITIFGDLNKGIVDNTYLWLIYHSGFIVFISYLLIYMFSVKKMFRNRVFLLPLFLFCLYSMLEHLDFYNYNFLLILELMSLMKNNNISYKWLKN